MQKKYSATFPSFLDKVGLVFKRKETKWFLWVTFIAYALIEAKRPGDFYIFIDAARALLSGEDIYLKHYGAGFNYYYSPLFATILSRFTFLPDYIIKAVWLLFNCFFVQRIFKICIPYLLVDRLEFRQQVVFWAISFLLTYRFFYFNFHYIQMNIFLLFAILQSTDWIRKGKSLPGGILLSMAINFKIIPLLVIPWLIYRAYFKATMVTLVFLVISLFLPAFLIGFDYNMQLHDSWYKLINPFNTNHLIDNGEPALHSLTTFFSVYLTHTTPSQYELPLSRHIVDLSPENVIYFINGARILLLVGMLFFLRTPPFRKQSSGLNHFREIAYLVLIIVLMAPHQQLYAFVFSVPSILLISRFYAEEPSNRGLLLSLVSVFILNVLIGGILGFMKDFSIHYKLVTWGALLTTVLVWLTRKKEII